MTLEENIKSDVEMEVNRKDILLNVTNKLQSQVGFNNIRSEITPLLENIKQQNNDPASFVFLGQQGLGKTIVARDLVTNYLFAINKISRPSFLKIEPNRLDKKVIAKELSNKFDEGKGGLIFIDEVHNLKDIEIVFFYLLTESMKSEEFKMTSFIISAGGKSWVSVKERYPILKINFQHQIYFRAYTDGELLAILKEIILNDNLFRIPNDYELSNIISQLKAITIKHGSRFKNASDLMFYYQNCLKKTIENSDMKDLNENMRNQSIKTFESLKERRLINRNDKFHP